MAKITPVEFPLNQGTANNLYVKSLGFGAEDTSCVLYYELQETSQNLETNSTTINIIKVGNVNMTEEAFAAWGQDNSYLNEYVADILGVTLVLES
jgi:hypothetical protein